LKILYLSHTVSWKGGGIFFTAFHQGKILAERGHKVTLVSISPSARVGIRRSTISGIDLIETPDLFWGKARTGWDPWDLLLRLLILENSNYDIVHGFESRPIVSIPALRMKKHKKVPIIFTWADWFGRGGKGGERGKILSLLTAPLETYFEEKIYPFADGIIAMGWPLAERARAIGISKDRIKILLHGSDVHGIMPLSQDVAREAFPHLPKKGSILGYLGALREENAKLLFDAFTIFRSHYRVEAKLVLIGNTKLDWKRYAPIECQLDVIESGWVSYESINLYLNACDLLILPLKKTIATDNVWPSKLNDYLAAGKPIAATNMRVYSGLFEKNEFGRLSEDNPKALAEACLELMRDPDLRKTMGQKARNYAVNELAWERLVDQLEDYYLQIIARLRPA
jgi:glycosyltransferase involved in cell wall biosynthesis